MEYADAAGGLSHPGDPAVPAENIRDLLKSLYPDGAERAFEAVMNLIGSWREKRGDRVRPSRLDEKDVMLIVYGDSIREDGEPPLSTLGKFLDRYARDVVSAVHLLPIFPFTSDDGFSVVDYYRIDPALGTWEHVDGLSRDFDLMLDAVVNHVSKSSAWFNGFLSGDDRYRDFFILADPGADYSTVVRPRALPLLTTFRTDSGPVHVWTTFSEDQIDLNFRNPGLLVEILNVLCTYASHGARFIRLDAVGFLWKELGTSCMHRPQTHALVKLMRAVLDLAFPGTLLITETNVPHADNIGYFGNGADEAHLVYQFTLPPLVLFSFLSGNALKLSRWAETLQAVPLAEGTAYFNFLASHDGIGMRPVEDILTDREKELMVETVIRHGGRIGYRAGGDGSLVPYELNINYLDALTDPDKGSIGERADRFIASQAILLSMAGMPGIYIHSLVGSRNWIAGVEESGINRRINREKLELSRLGRELDAPGSLRNEVFSRFSRLIRLRRGYPAFSPSAGQTVLFTDERAFSLLRHNDAAADELFVHVNVSGDSYDIPFDRIGIDLVSNEAVDRGLVRLDPYQVRWIIPD